MIIFIIVVIFIIIMIYIYIFNARNIYTGRLRSVILILKVPCEINLISEVSCEQKKLAEKQSIF